MNRSPLWATMPVVRRSPGGTGPAQRGRAVLALAVFVLPVAVTVSAAMPRSVGGRVTDATGTAVADARVASSAPLVPGTTLARTDAGGRYTLAGGGWPLPTTLDVRAPGFAPTRTGGGPVVLHRWPRVSGRAVDDTGAPVPGALVTLSRARRLWTTVADQQGAFSVVADHGAGTGWLAVQAERHEPAYETPRLAPDGDQRFVFVLPRLLGTVHLDSNPSGQRPLVDGQPAESCPQTPCELALAVGPHHVEFVNDLFVPWAQDLQVDKGAAVDFTARLERKTGTLALAPPARGELTVDGHAVDGGGWTGTVPTGKHSIEFRSAATWPLITEADVSWNQTTEARLAPAPVTPGDSAAFLQNLHAYLDTQGGSYGVYLESLGSGATLGVGQDSRLEAASVIKLPVALYLLHQVDAAQLQVEDQVELRDEDFMGGTGTLISTAHAGDKHSYGELLALMIQQSDNTAWKALDRALGADHIDAFAASLGAGDCRQGADSCTAREAGQLLSQLARGQLLSGASTQKLLGLLESTAFNDRINYYLGGTTIAHKVGMDGSVINDCGVVYLPGNPFTVCVFTTTNDPNRGAQVIRDVARAAAHYYGR